MDEKRREEFIASIQEGVVVGMIIIISSSKDNGSEDTRQNRDKKCKVKSTIEQRYVVLKVSRANVTL